MSGLFSLIGDLFGGGAQKKASALAMQAQTDALNRAITIGNEQFQQTRQDYMPYTTAGQGAIGELSTLIGGGLSPDQLTARIQANPLYESLYRNGEEALLQTAAATGGLRGGNTQLGLADFGADTLANVYGIVKSDLGNLAGLGLGATGQVAGFGANNANNAANLTTQVGDARARNYLTRGGINAQNWQNAGGWLDSVMNSFIPGFGGEITAASTARLNPVAQQTIAANGKYF